MVRVRMVLVVQASLLALLAAGAASAAPISGAYSSPMGTLNIKEDADGTVVGTLADAKNPCNFAKGTAVFNGARLDDSVAGSFRMCKLAAEGCSGSLEGDAILLVGKNSLSGTVHLDGGGCKTPMTGDAITMKKAGVKPPPGPPKPSKGNRERAEALAKEAHPLIMAGQAEEARKKCQEAVKLDAGFSQGYTCIGITYFLRDRYEEALEQYKLALEADPSNRDVYYNMGCIFAVQNKQQEALEYLKLAVLNGYIDLNTLSTDSDLKNLNGNPIFEKLKLGQFD